MNKLPAVDPLNGGIFVSCVRGKASGHAGVHKTSARDLEEQGSYGIRKQLDTAISPTSKLTRAVKKPRATWVDPVFVADIEYRDITSEGLLRQSSFKGMSKKER